MGGDAEAERELVGNGKGLIHVRDRFCLGGLFS